MSFYNTFKRIALLSAATLVSSGIVAVSANAAGADLTLTNATSIVTSGTGPYAISGNQIAGPANYSTVTDNFAGTATLYVTVTGGTFVGGATTITANSGSALLIATPHVGTITVNAYEIVSGTASTTAQTTVTLTVVGALPGTVYASSTILAAPSTGLPTLATDAAFSITQPAGAVNVANFTVAELDAAGNAMNPSNAKPITVISTNMYVSSPNLAASPSGNTTFLTGTPLAATTDFVLSGINGFGGGVATVQISINGVLTKTYSAKFTGPASKIVLTPINSVVGIGIASSLLPTSLVATGVTANTNALEVQEFDANGNVLAFNQANITLTSSTPGIAVSGALDSVANYPLGGSAGGGTTSASTLGVSVTGVSAGTTSFTATDSSLTLTSAAVPIRVSNGIPTAVVITSNLADYPAGGAGTLTTTVSNAAGTLPAGTYVVFTGQAVASVVVSAGIAQLPGAPATVVGPPPVKIGQITVNGLGIYTDAFNAPLNAGNISISGTPISNTITVTPATFTVAGGVPTIPVASIDSLLEAADSVTVDSELAISLTALADAADKPGNDVGPLATAALASISAHAALVIKVRAKSAALATSMAAIMKKIGKK